MLDRSTVAADVAITMKDVLVDLTPFTDEDPDESDRGFHFRLVPSKERWEGWNAGQGAWHINLEKIAEALREVRPEYSSVDITAPNVVDTLNQPLSRARDMLIEKILNGNADGNGDGER